MDSHVSIHAHPRYLVATDAAAFVVAELVLFALSRIRVLVSPLASVLLGIGVLAGFAADVGLWFWKGIRAAEISDDVLTVYQGRSLLPLQVKRAVVLRLRVSRLPGSRTIRLRTMSGRRLRMTENAFQRDEYTRFLTALREWAPRA
jgi:hypothetical protein